MFRVSLNVMNVLGEEKIDLLLKINPMDEKGMPKTEGVCQWCAIEAAKVLLDQTYKPQAISNLVNNQGDDPIEALNKNDAHFLECRGSKALFARLKTLQNGELLMVNGGAELSHAYIIYHKAGVNWLIDADRNVYQPITSEEDLIQRVSGWEKDRPKNAKFNYGNIQFTQGKKENGKEQEAILDTYKLSKRDLAVLPKAEFKAAKNEETFFSHFQRWFGGA